MISVDQTKLQHELSKLGATIHIYAKGVVEDSRKLLIEQTGLLQQDLVRWMAPTLTASSTVTYSHWVFGDWQTITQTWSCPAGATTITSGVQSNRVGFLLDAISVTATVLDTPAVPMPSVFFDE